MNCNSQVSTVVKRSAVIMPDTTVLKETLYKALKWHYDYGQEYDFIEKNGIYTGVDLNRLERTIIELQKLNIFCQEFILNFRTIGTKIDYRIKHDTTKYRSGLINFSFQDYDTWTDSQWQFEYDDLKIAGLSVKKDISDLTWTVKSMKKDPYHVIFRFVDNTWKISSFEGFTADKF